MGRGLRQPIRSAMLAGSVGKGDLGKSFGFHEALDTTGALLGPAIALILLAAGHDFRTVFAVALIPGVLAVTFFGVLTRDPRRGPGEPVSLRVPLPGSFWRLIAAVAVFGVGNFATAFFTLRAAQMLQPELSRPAALSAAVGFSRLERRSLSRPDGWPTASARCRCWPRPT